MKTWLIGGIILLFLGIVAVFWFVFSDKITTIFGQSMDAELAQVAEMRGSFGDLAEYFKVLAEEKGAVYAYDVLREAELGPNIDIHLLGHVVGDELYKQKGFEGISLCTRDFRNACSHTIVIGALLERGEGVFNSVHDVCKKAPGGSGAYTMCFHGFGHGVLAYNDYEIPDAVSMCEGLGTAAYNDREYVECVGGAVMEMVSGVHDPVVWEAKKEEYIPENDPLYLCKSDIIPADAKSICYTYITPQLFEASGATVGRPNPEYFDESFAYCDSIPESEQSNRDACYGGLGKEFIVLVQDRDIRDFSKMTDEQLQTVVEWCGLAGNEFGKRSCITHAANSLYWGGENPVEVPRRFCEQVDDRGRQEHCMGALMWAIDYYIPRDDRSYREDFCESVDQSHARACNNIVL